ncbi:MAG: primosomal protein N' [Prevotella sp.]|nr:primosomal protein N' [Prevotella sp.]MCM1074908.1 primosomal protein N' [Ruminococcus sp.]
MTRYADVILPLPIYGAFTYSIPEQMQADIRIGSRVLVPFNKTGSQTGIVENIHTAKPTESIEVKEIVSLLDNTPIVSRQQLKFWKWIADYYLCTTGEVMKAALPAALKVESENILSLASDIDPDDIQSLNDAQAALYAYLSHKKKARINEIEKDTDIPNPRIAINQLIDKGLIQISEKVVNKYVTRKATLVSLSCNRENKQALHDIMTAVSKSAQREKLLITYLDLSEWLKTSEPLHRVEKKTLLDRAGVSSAIFNALVKIGIFRQQVVKLNRFSPIEGTKPGELPTLSSAQNEALRKICLSMSEHTVTLLRGVTGSGKTEIYTHLIDRALTHGDHVLMLVPEISLTTQLTSRLNKIFGDRMLVYHSKFSDSERVDIWRRVNDSHSPMLILGVRSSVFLPYLRLGLVIVDEEHESSYKQYDPAPRYNARDAAIMLASMHGAKVLLGSATPAVDTYYKAQTGKYGLVELLTRYADVSLPAVQIVDMTECRKQKRVTGAFSSELLARIRSAAEAEKQSIIFQNRRGFAPIVTCSQCGWTPRCPNCDISLVLHRRENLLKCHYCGYVLTPPTLCPACGSNAIYSFGYGTERIADHLQAMLPDVPIARMDLDTTRAKDAYQDIIEKFSKGDTRILIGTQMVTKGLDFKDVVLVGIVNADALINFPDFRSNERAFCTLEQVAGRAGRHEDNGLVMIQTNKPDHPVIEAVKNHNYTGFYNAELQQRRQFSYPPFAKIINIYLRHKDEKTLEAITASYGATLRQYFGTRLLGPDTPGISRIANYHIRTFMLKIEPQASMPKVKQILRAIYAQTAASPGMKTLRLHYDVDPA